MHTSYKPQFWYFYGAPPHFGADSVTFFFERIRCTLKTWKASNWMLGLLSLRRFIMSFRFSGLLMYRVMTVKLCLSRSSSPSSCHITHKHVMLITGQAREDKNQCHNTHLQRLSLGHVVLRVKQFLIVIKNLEDQGQPFKNVSFPKFYDKN